MIISLPSLIEAIVFIIFPSNSLSIAFVASSNINTEGSWYSALAIPILCFCPPDNLTPLSPTIVLMPEV